MLNKKIFYVLTAFVIATLLLSSLTFAQTVYKPALFLISDSLKRYFETDVIAGYVTLALGVQAQVSSGEAVLNSNHAVCSGDILKLSNVKVNNKILVTGGYSTESCPGIRPAIGTPADTKGFENLNQLIDSIERGEFSDDNIPGYVHSICKILPDGTGKCTGRNKFYCDVSCEVEESVGLLKLSEDSFQTTKPGKASLNLRCKPKCILFIDEPRLNVYGYAVVPPDNIPLFVNSLNLNVLDKEAKPKVDLVSSNVQDTASRDQNFYVRVNVRNTADFAIKFDDIKLNTKSGVVYKPKVVNSGDVAEIILKASADSPKDLKLRIESSSDNFSCGGVSSNIQEFDLGKVNVETRQCTSDLQCSQGETCCSGFCFDSTKGFCADIDGDGIPEWHTR